MAISTVATSVRPLKKLSRTRQASAFTISGMTAASLLIAKARTRSSSRRVGHASITMTLDRYGHLFPSVEEALAEKLDAVFESAQAPSNVVAIGT
jgi:integrase